ncbi:MAG TPA: hypothetical protein VK390_17100, partial [Propionibacteriaceae bacterium]|nr:hypothetical protein [Propionibacteriaceae bacterium]
MVIVGAVPADLVPLVVLELSLAAPVEGWAIYLADRGISITINDIGRASVSRSDARQLLTEQREAEVRRREKAAELERQAVERDRAWRAQLGGGIPAYAIPDGVAPAAAMLQAAVDARPRRTSVLQEALAGEALTFHPIGP